MTERKLLGVLDHLLNIINNQDFKNPQHEQKVKRLHDKVTVQLFEKSAELKVMELRFRSNMNREENVSSFIPKIADNFPVGESTAGVVVGGDSKEVPVKRPLLGRVCSGAENGDVKVLEYYKPQGQDDSLLLGIAKKHWGFTGEEAVVTRVIPRSEAKNLLFSGVGN